MNWLVHDNAFVGSVESGMRFGSKELETALVEGETGTLDAKPNKFRWTLEAPTAQSKIFDGKDFLEYDKGSNSAIRYSPTGPQAYDLRQIVDVVLNFDSLLKRYDLVKADQDGDMIKIELKPKTDVATPSGAARLGFARTSGTGSGLPAASKLVAGSSASGSQSASNGSQ